jgi:hypothetical protein
MDFYFAGPFFSQVLEKYFRLTKWECFREASWRSSPGQDNPGAGNNLEGLPKMIEGQSQYSMVLRKTVLYRFAFKTNVMGFAKRSTHPTSFPG